MDFSEGGCPLHFNWRAIKQNLIAAEQVKIASYFLPKRIADVNVVVYLSLRKKEEERYYYGAVNNI